MERNEATLLDAIKNTYLPHLVQDYAGWSDKSDICDEMTREFGEGLSFKKGRNYVKIITSRHGDHVSVHSFIVIKPTKGFEIGDILKAASWNAPALNFKRGNVFELHTLANVTWTGAQ